MPDLILHHHDGGAGPPVVLLHSTVADAGMWEPLLPVLTARFRVVAPDLRGFGSSPLPPHPYAHAADVVRLLDHLGIERCALVGSSGGGRVALQIASAVPERVLQMILLCPAADGIEPTTALRAVWDGENALVEAGDLDGAARLNADQWLGPDAGETVREAVFAMQRHALEIQTGVGDVEEEDWEIDLGRLGMPVTVVIGALDLDFFAAVGHDLVARLPNARLIELEWAGHLPTLERPAAMGALLTAELAAGDRR